jgi:hypothetical protein
MLCCSLYLLLGDVEGQIEESVGVAPFVIVPGDELNEVGVKGDTGLSIEDGGSGITNEILGDDFFISVSEDTLQFTFGGFLDDLADFFIRGTLFQLNSQIDDGDIQSGNSERHTGQFTFKVGDNLSDGLGSTSAGGNDVSTSGSTGSPVLTTLGGTINDELGGGGSMDGGHETFSDLELVVEDLSEGSETVGGAGSIGDDVLFTLVFVVVDTDDVHGGIILGGSRHDDLLGTRGKMGLGLFLGEVNTGTFENDIRVRLSPLDGLNILFSEDSDLLAIDDDVITVVSDIALESAVDGVVLELVDQVIQAHEGIVDSGDFDLGVLEGSSEGESSDSTETVDTEFNRHER